MCNPGGCRPTTIQMPRSIALYSLFFPKTGLLQFNSSTSPCTRWPPHCSLRGKTETSPSTNPSNFLAFGEATG